MTTNKQDRSLTTGMEEEWLQASEARYDSMRNLLQSVKHDIDALTSKIDMTQTSPTSERAARFGDEPKRSAMFLNMQNERKDNGQVMLHPFCTDSGAQLYPTHSDAEKALKDLAEGDEYMEIKIREAKQHFPLYGSEDQLLDCTVALSHRKPDHEEGKTWRSPSDFNLHDPFDEDIIHQEFRKELRPCLVETHRHQAIKETDLDDLKSDSYTHEVDSDRSISPAVSPTFEICANENVQLSNMLITKDETGHFQFNSNDVNGKTNHVEYQVCDNEHALTTIDEASEEIEDDWSSSDLDASVGNNEHAKSNHVPQTLSATLPNQSIKVEFKTLSDSTLIPLTVHTGEDDATQADSRKLKSCSLKNTVGIESGYPVASTNASTGQKVWLRPKRTETEFGSPIKQRPISAGSLRAHLRNSDSSMPGSIHSISSTFSQESVISEADSYVTVNSRFGTTGSDEVYITACSDSEVQLQSPVQLPCRQDEEDCSTLSRRRTKLPRNQRHRTKDLVPIGDSSSDEEFDETLIRSEAIVVTPKFSRLPSKITSPNESISVIRYGTYPQGEQPQTSQSDSHQSRAAESPTTGTYLTHKRTVLQRPNRSPPTLEHRAETETAGRSDSDVCSSPDSSSSADEADYDASRSTVWNTCDFNSGESMLLPKLFCKPSLKSDISTEAWRKCLDSIEETSVSSQIYGERRELNENTNQQAISTTGPVTATHITDSTDKSSTVIMPKYFLNSQEQQKLNVSAVTAKAAQPQCETEEGRASTCDGKTGLVEQNQPISSEIESGADVNACALIGPPKDNINHPKFAIAIERVTSGCTADGQKNIFTLNEQGADSANAHIAPTSTVEEQPTTKPTDTEKEMPGARATYYRDTNSVNAQKHNTTHIYNDGNQEMTKQAVLSEPRRGSSMRTNNCLSSDGNKRTPLSLAVVVASAEATAARPLTYSPLPSMDMDVPLMLRTAEFKDVHFDGHPTSSESTHPYFSTTCERPLHSAGSMENNSLNSCQTERVLRNTNTVDSLHVDSVLTPVTFSHSLTHNTDAQSRSSLQFASREFATPSIPSHSRTHLTTTEVRELPHQKVMTAVTNDVRIYLDNEPLKSPSLSAASQLHRQMQSPLHSSSNEDPKHPVFSTQKPNVQTGHSSTQWNNDIQAATQRTSRILHGQGDYLDDAVKLVMAPQVPVPQRVEHTYVDSQTADQPITTKSNYGKQSDRLEHEPHNLKEGFSRRMNFGKSDISQEVTKFDTKLHIEPTIQVVKQPQSVLINNVYSPTDTYPQLEQVKPTYVSHVSGLLQAEPVSFLQSSNEQRTCSPSPPRIHKFRSTGPRSSPPMIRPKWHLKPIPTDNEIRERLRSRSRQRLEERQSRPFRPDSITSHRPRSSRSDSRYRCTDLDSVIAESRTDTLDVVHSSVPESGVLSEARPSASLFDLDDRSKLGIPQTPRTVGATNFTGIQTMGTRGVFGEAKSYTSLLETDIDTGENFERPIVLETDVDNLQTRMNSQTFHELQNQKTRSLFNLTYANTPGTHRRLTTSNVIARKVSPSPTGIEASENWHRTKSLQGLPNSDQESSATTVAHDFRTYSHTTKIGGIGAKGLLDRLRDRAKSTHELRIAQSLTKLRVPEWLDKAECLTHSVIEGVHPLDDDLCDLSNRPYGSGKNTLSKQFGTDRSRSLVSSVRSLSSVRKAGEAISPKWIQKTGTIIETVAEPMRPRVSGSHQPRFVRPSQEMRDRGSSASRLQPINSKLYSSMRSLAYGRGNPENPPQSHLGLPPQVAPRAGRPKGQSTEMKLSPQDFIPKYEQIWGRDLQRLRQPKVGSRPTEPHQPNVTENAGFLADLPDADNDYFPVNPSEPQQQKQMLKPNQTFRTSDRSFEDIKPADYDSGTEHSGEHIEMHSTKPYQEKEQLSLNPKVQNGEVIGDTQYSHTSQQTKNVQQNTRHARQKYSHFDSTDMDSQISPQTEQEFEPTKSEWRVIDAEGETESEATDGLDQISDLTCLTSLIDTCAARHRALLANRPSALEHLLTSLGWWPSVPKVEHQHLPPTAAEAISIAAHEFDVDEDSHRTEFIQLLAGPESRRPINLGEFALNQLSGSVRRKPEDGLLYISCGRSECTKLPVQVGQALDWRACANCYTLYCSTTCRSIDRQAFHDHPTVCSFARAKRVCNRLLRNLAPGQVTGLTALAKTGMARLGRGGILLPFALVRHAELFLQRARAQPFLQEEHADSSAEQARACWDDHHQPSPGGVMSPPLYLTLNELEQLDSTVANPCRTYVPSTSMVIIVVVCAYELIARADGRPVHLFKQSLILPFPAHNTGGGGANNVRKSSLTERRGLLNKPPVLPQTNGVLSKPDRQASAAREAYMIRLQRILRERGVSLRHHHPDIYTHIANFVETGVPFHPIRIVFHDFVLREEVLCTIQPMSDPQIVPTRQLQSQGATNADTYEAIVEQEADRANKTRQIPNSPSDADSARSVNQQLPETDF
ncbi:hypothetical protein EG68_01865 [Paragonimus skrjabini miyazakii]|uniref:Uncharacterized protein n=1 Tax=Paragonimus skrjabini miyazakii TaxID=59628 RepID=A0A8S9Z6Y2_9TREM|nr:hypothetical protein EG68_01865 [Paragonimus skrjabini miyazakii]